MLVMTNKHHHLCCKVVIIIDMTTMIGLFLFYNFLFHVFSSTIFPLTNKHTHTHTLSTTLLLAEIFLPKNDFGGSFQSPKVNGEKIAKILYVV
jgi:hypothetical protein